MSTRGSASTDKTREGKWEHLSDLARVLITMLLLVCYCVQLSAIECYIVRAAKRVHHLCAIHLARRTSFQTVHEYARQCVDRQVA